ncbi:MAG: hypothetical protein ABIZ80_20445 [Bryobacteraceae bacterium]
MHSVSILRKSGGTLQRESRTYTLAVGLVLIARSDREYAIEMI